MTTAAITHETTFDDLYPSRFLTAASLEGKTLQVRITDITQEEIGQPPQLKRILSYTTKNGEAKEMVLNKTNAARLAQAFGKKVIGWRGRVITIYTEYVPLGGKVVPGLRVRTNGTKPAASPLPAKPLAPPAAAAAPTHGDAYEGDEFDNDDDDLADDIPQ
ncbi:MAG TPA: hypothetical protein VF814_08680 [Casimicrobiaceae bacterium]